MTSGARTRGCCASRSDGGRPRSRGAVGPLRRTRAGPRRRARAARPHPGRPGRDRAARSGPRFGRALARRHAAVPPAVVSAAAGGASGGDPRRLRRTRAHAVARPAQLDPPFTRARLRTEVLPLLEDVLGGGVADALARTADRAARGLRGPRRLARPTCDAAIAGEGLDTGAADSLPDALRRRVIRGWLLAGGATDLTDGRSAGGRLGDELARPGRCRRRVFAAQPATGRGPQRRQVAAAPRTGLTASHWSALCRHGTLKACSAEAAEMYSGDIKSVLLSEDEIQTSVASSAPPIGDATADIGTQTARTCCW